MSAAIWLIVDVERTLRGGKGRVTSTGYEYDVFVLNVSVFVQTSCTVLVTFHFHRNTTLFNTPIQLLGRRFGIKRNFEGRKLWADLPSHIKIP